MLVFSRSDDKYQRCANGSFDILPLPWEVRFRSRGTAMVPLSVEVT